MNIKEQWYKHDISILNQYGVPVPGSPMDLFREIREMNARFLVDTNIPWETYSAMPKYAQSAFILGSTIAREKKPSTIFENSSGKKIRHNVFIFSLWPPREGGLAYRIAIERLDEYALSIRKKEELHKGDDPNYRIEEYNSPSARQQEKFNILHKLELESLADLANLKRLRESSERLIVGLKHQAKACFKDYRKCIEVAEAAYAVLLANSQSARHEFLQEDPLDRNVFGDTEIIHNALFFGASVLSKNHKHVGEMAKYCNLDYHESLT